MKVELNGPASAQLAAETNVKPAAATSAATTHAVTADHTTFKADQTVQTLVSTALRTPEIRQAVVETLRNAVSSGTYETNASQTAGAIASQHS